MLTLAALLALACSGTPEPEPEPEPAPMPESAPAPDAAPFPPGIPTDGPAVSVAGYGVRLTLQPPFQVAKLGKPDAPEMLIVAWWDVGASGAGQSGSAGLYNFTVVPGNPDATGPIMADTVTEEGEQIHVLRRGADGTELRFPRGISGLGGAGALTEGPADPVWVAQIGDGTPEPFPSSREMLHSWDPATGEAARFQLQPVRPWGPWKTPKD